MEFNESSRRETKSEVTKRRILEAARRLFNQDGTAGVSTNHIAAEAGISPGNLYYHFADKAEIIRALFSQYASAHEEHWDPSPDHNMNVARLAEDVTVAGSGLGWEYRFFERELRALLRADPQLSSAYLHVYERRLDQWVLFGERLVAQGVLRPPGPPSSMRDLAMAIWLIAESWMGFLEVTGDPEDPAQVAKVTDLIAVTIAPYLTAKGRRSLTAELLAGGSRGRVEENQGHEGDTDDAS